MSNQHQTPPIEQTVTLPISKIVELVADLLSDFDNLATLIGQCGYHSEMEDTSGRIIAEMLYLGERTCRLSKDDVLRQLPINLAQDGGINRV